MSEAFVTGATGFLGGALVKELLARGWSVTALTRKDNGAFKGMAVNLVEGSLSDEKLLASAMKKGCAVFHLAGMVSFAERDREKLMEVNARGTESVLRAAEAAGASKVVITSSAITLGARGEAVIVDETQPVLPEWRERNAYLASKAAQEDVAMAAAKRGLQVVITNPSTVFGPGDRAMNSGSFIKTALNKKIIASPPGGGSMVDVRDVADGLIKAFEKGKSGERYVLTNENMTFADMFRTIASAVNKNPFIVKVPDIAKPVLMLAAGAYSALARAAGMKNMLITPQIIGGAFGYKWFSAAKAASELGWIPKIRLAQSAADAYNYYKREGLL